MSKRLDNNEENQLEAGRESLPSSSYNEADFEEREDTDTPKRIRPNDPPHPSAVRWLWTGVICFVVVIALMWGWSLKNQFSSINWKDSSEQKIIDTAKENFEEAFKGNWSEELNKNEVKNKLQEAIAAFKEAALKEVAETTSSTALGATSTVSTTKK